MCVFCAVWVMECVLFFSPHILHFTDTAFSSDRQLIGVSKQSYQFQSFEEHYPRNGFFMHCLDVFFMSTLWRPKCGIKLWVYLRQKNIFWWTIYLQGFCSFTQHPVSSCCRIQVFLAASIRSLWVNTDGTVRWFRCVFSPHFWRIDLWKLIFKIY